MTNNVNKRLFLNLEYIQGEEVSLMFDVAENCEQLFLDEYDLTGSVMEDFNDTPVATFTFAESDVSQLAWVATILSSTTLTLVPKVYDYEIKMSNKLEGRPETLFYGTLTIKPTRIP